ncbi:MAG TPA: Hsp20 family protein [Streptosporangiaceae bacterium]
MNTDSTFPRERVANTDRSSPTDRFGRSRVIALVSYRATRRRWGEVHRSERCYGAFRHSITLPSHVQADKIEASAQDGVLHIVVPRAKEVQAKRIQVRAGQGGTAATAGAQAATAADSNPGGGGRIAATQGL